MKQLKKTLQRKSISFKKMFFLLLCLASASFINAQSVNGSVTDENGEPLIGVSILVKGTSIGTITDLDGKFTISSPVVNNAPLVFSLIGYKTEEVLLKGRTTVDLILKEDNQLLDEVVVVGFQSQKKVNLTGAITSVSSDVLENRPVANIGQALQGVIPNLNIGIENGAPNTVPSFNIRGGTSMEKNKDTGVYEVKEGSPLILLDGIEITNTQLNQLNPNDISNISVIKDASAAAIYGTKATYGVILVQTKGGNFNQKAKINYSYDVSWDKPSALPDILDSYTIQLAAMNKTRWTGGSVSTSAEKKLEGMLNYMNNPTPENAWIDDNGGIVWVATMNPYKKIVRDWTPTQKHNVSINGGGKDISYYFSLGYQDQEGMYKINTDEYKRYNGMMGFNAKLKDWFNLSAKVSYSRVYYKAPYLEGGKGNVWANMKNTEVEKNINMPIMTGPNDPTPNTYTDNLLAWISNGAYTESTSTTTIFSASPEFIILKNVLKVKADLSFTPTTYNQYRKMPQFLYITPAGWNPTTQQGTDQNKARLERNSSDMYTINAYVDFNKTINKKHNISAVLGFNQEKYTYGQLVENLNTLFSPDIVNPKAAEDLTQHTLETDKYIRTGRAGFGRINYNYDNRYLFEVNGRYDGSSRFTKKDRFFFFPSFSLGWRISEEKFMNSTEDWLDNLKIRGSWGKLGNQPGNNYPYQATMDSEKYYYLLNGKQITGVKAPGLVSPSLTWEKARTMNLGLDVTLLQGKFDLSFDIFDRKVTDVLTDGAAAYPEVLGAAAPLENSGTINVKGWEVSLTWRDRLRNGLSYDISLNVSDSRSKVVHYAGNKDNLIFNKSDRELLYSGKYVGEIWGYETGGILQVEDFAGQNDKGAWIFNGPNQFKNTLLYPGYVWYKDINGDGKVDNGYDTVEDSGDRKIIGNNTPRYKFGITGNIAYKGFDLNLFFQGVGKRDVWIKNTTYWGAAAGSKWMYDRSWTPERTNAKYPMYNIGLENRPQTGFLLSGAYLRLKQVVLGYTLPASLTRKAAIERLRFTISGYNIFEITELPDTFDPDQITDQYPSKRTIALGVQIGF